MQQNIDTFETFKCAAIPAPRTPSRSLILPATPIPDVSAERLHRERYDAVLVTYKPRAFRAAILLALFSWLLLLIGCIAVLFAVWRYLP